MIIPKPTDFRKARDVYRVERETVKNKPGTWDSNNCKVIKTNPDGTEEVVFEYLRTYLAFYNTFEPFRQIVDGRWHDYALYSASYTTFCVVDLEAGVKIAERPYPQRDWYRKGDYDEYEVKKAKNPEWFEEGGYYAGKGAKDKINGEGFCPVDFYVPDLMEWLEDDDAPGTAEKNWKFYLDSKDGKDLIEEAFTNYAGQFGFYSGCIWGDDSSWKLRYIDLSEITKGKVSDDERFGYVEIAGTVKEAVRVPEYGGDYIHVAVDIPFRIKSGEASYWTKDGIKWGTKSNSD